jgi:hypothetical protein
MMVATRQGTADVVLHRHPRFSSKPISRISMCRSTFRNQGTTYSMQSRTPYVPVDGILVLKKLAKFATRVHPWRWSCWMQREYHPRSPPRIYCRVQSTSFILLHTHVFGDSPPLAYKSPAALHLLCCVLRLTGGHDNTLGLSPYSYLTLIASWWLKSPFGCQCIPTRNTSYYLQRSAQVAALPLNRIN